MSEPTNPLFEEEKAFLERKKLEYERALRGDVAQLKQQTADAGRVALVGAGLAGSIWLITKAFSSRKRHQPDQESDESYHSQRFDEYANEDEQDYYGADDWPETDNYFGSGDESDLAHGAVYHTDGDSYDNPTSTASDLDDNGLHDYPDFPEHSSHQHGAAISSDPFESEAYGHPESTLPFDDSRRLPESNDFTEEEESIDQYPGRDLSKFGEHPTPTKRNLGSKLVAFAQSGLGKVVVGQAASLAIALVTKAIKDKLPSDEPETTKTSDLAALTDSTDGYAHGHPATPQPDAYYAPADFRSDSPA